jgi:hypothetical protein
MNRATNRGILSFLALISIILTGGFGVAVAQAQIGIASASPASLSFSNVSVGTTSSQSVSISNSGNVAYVISGVSSSNSSFTASGIQFPSYVSPGQIVTLAIAFAPTTTSAQTGTITVIDNASNGYASITASGTAVSGTASNAVGIASTGPANLSFGSVLVGSTSSQSFAVSNPGSATFVISGVSSSNSSFTASGISFPTYVSPGQSVTLIVAFAPASTGAQSGTITVLDNASNGDASVAVSGSGGSGTTPTTGNCPCTLWPSTALPSIADVGADSPVELGVSFRADSNGYVTGVRFYKSSSNTGTHVGHLWTGSGTLLATATFTGETSSGWQQVNFSTPVAITANTVYVASYHSTVGHYSVNPHAFATSGLDNAPLHALENGVGGADGPFAYGKQSVFPTSTYNSANYWVDVVFSNTVLTSAPPPSITAQPARR